jgi:hypothetical protein
MPERCKHPGCGEPLGTKQAAIGNGYCARHAGKGDATISPAKLHEIAAPTRTPIGFGVEAAQAPSSEHECSHDVHKAPSARKAKPQPPSSEHVGETGEREALSTQLNLRVTRSMYDALTAIAEAEGITIPAIVRITLELYIQTYNS